MNEGEKPMIFEEPIIFDWRNQSIDKVEQRRNTYGLKVNKKEDLKELVEQPLLEACEELYLKGILTNGSNANLEGGNNAFIGVDYKTLSENNKKILQQIGYKKDSENSYVYKIQICDIDSNSTIKEVNDKAMEIVNKFERQKPIWLENAHEFSLDSFIDEYINLDNQEFIKSFGEEIQIKYQKLLDMFNEPNIDTLHNNEYERIIDEIKSKIKQRILNSDEFFKKVISHWKNKGYYYDEKKKTFLSNRDLRDENGMLINSG